MEIGSKMIEIDYEDEPFELHTEILPRDRKTKGHCEGRLEKVIGGQELTLLAPIDGWQKNLISRWMNNYIWECN